MFQAELRRLCFGRAVIRDIVPMEHAASMIGYVTMAMTIMPMLAPAVGGIFEEQWRYSLRLMYLWDDYHRFV